MEKNFQIYAAILVIALFVLAGCGATAPTAPTNLIAAPGTYPNFILNWQDNSNNENGFRIERKLTTQSTYTSIATTAANIITYPTAHATGYDKNYNFRTTAYNDVGSASSNIATVNTKAFCQLTPNPGPCKGLFTKYYFNPSTGTCQQFSWGGCQGTVPFNTLTECQTICPSTTSFTLVDNGVYPYDPTFTGTKKYKVSLHTNGTGIIGHTIKNDAEIWTTPNGGAFDLGPLYPFFPNQSLTGHTPTSATFLQSLPTTTPGFAFVKARLDGFETKPETTVYFGQLPVGATAGIQYRADDDTLKNIPFYIKVNDVNGTFPFDGSEIYTGLTFGRDGKIGTFDTQVTVKTGDYVNERQWTIQTTPSNIITVQNLGQFPIITGSIFTVDGTKYKIISFNSSPTQTVTIAVDTIVELRRVNPTGQQIYNIAGLSTSSTYGKLFLSNNSTFDGTRNGTRNTQVTVGLFSSDSSRKTYYAAKYTTNDLWFLLDAIDFGFEQGNQIQFGKKIKFMGTRVPYDNGIYTETLTDFTPNPYGPQIMDINSAFSYGHYIPKTSDFNSAGVFNNLNAYLVAEFIVENNLGDDSNLLRVYINTATGQPLGPFPAPNLSSYSCSVKGNLDMNLSWCLQSGSTPTFLKKVYTSSGSKVQLVETPGDGNSTTITMPQQRKNIQLVVSDSVVQKLFVQPLNSSAEVNSRTLTNAELPVLINDAAFTETIDITIDARMNVDSSVKDLVATINIAAFAYKANKKVGTISVGSCAPLFGQYYKVTNVQPTGTTSITFDLSKPCLYEGNRLTGLAGTGGPFSLKLVDVGQPTPTTYNAAFELYNSSNQLVNNGTFTTGQNIKNTFTQLTNQLTISSIAVDATTGIGKVELQIT